MRHRNRNRRCLRIALIGMLSMWFACGETLADSARQPGKSLAPETKKIAKSASLADCRITVTNAAASIDRSPIVGPGKRPGPFQANVTLTFDNTASAKPATFKIASGTVRDSAGKDYRAVWRDAFTAKVWDGKVPAGKIRKVHFFYRMKTELQPEATMILQVSDVAGKKVWLRSDSVPVRILK